MRCIASQLARWSNDNALGLREAQPLLPGRFNNRLARNWQLLLAIAELGGKVWSQQARDAAERLTRTRVEPSWRQLLLQTVARLKADGNTWVYSKTLVAELTRDPTSPWVEYQGHRHTGRVTERQVAYLLKAIEIYPTLCGPQRLSGYVMADFAKAFAHFPVQVERMRGSLRGCEGDVARRRPEHVQGARRAKSRPGKSSIGRVGLTRPMKNGKG